MLDKLIMASMMFMEAITSNPLLAWTREDLSSVERGTLTTALGLGRRFSKENHTALALGSVSLTT